MIGGLLKYSIPIIPHDGEIIHEKDTLTNTTNALYSRKASSKNALGDSMVIALEIRSNVNALHLHTQY